MEIVNGVQDNLIIRLKNLSEKDLLHAIEFQVAIAHGKQNLILSTSPHENNAIEKIAQQFPSTTLQQIKELKDFDFSISNTAILVTGKSTLATTIFNRLQKREHSSFMKIDWNALQNNIEQHQNLLPSTTKLMAMVKANAYGLGLEMMSCYIASLGVNYLGVAYLDEGIVLRKVGIQTPIMVMNVPPDSLHLCFKYQLEASVYSMEHLDTLLACCSSEKRESFPIHLKVDTGMHRLGFAPNEMPGVITKLQQEGVFILKSIYSHLADSDNVEDRTFTEQQIATFSEIVATAKKMIPYSFETHLLNSNGIANYPNAPFSMARIGIGMLGITSNANLKKQLQPVLRWYSSVSQVRTIAAGESVSYGRTYRSDKQQQIAVISVGYADGFKRSLSNGVGRVFIHGVACEVLGIVCMDMLVVDASSIEVKPGDEVEIVGLHQSLEDMATLQNTIPYEVTTSIAQRIQRRYILK